MSAATGSAVQASPGAPARWRPDTRGWAIRGGVMFLLFAVLVWRLLTISGIWADRISVAAIFAVIGLSLNIILGYTGQVSLGHHAFVGFAAFLSAFWVTEQGGCVPEEGCTAAPTGAFITAVLIAILSGVIAAGLLGMIALRIKGLYLSLITLTYGFVAVNSLFEIPALTRGGAGMPAPRPTFLATDHRFMWFAIAAVALCLVVDWRLLASKAGRAILAVKESESVAATYAINVTVYKLMAFMLSGAFAGLAGALFAYRRGIVVAVDFSFSVALVWVLMVVVGGLGSRLGVVIGSAFFAMFAWLVSLISPLEHFILGTLGRDPEELVLVIGPLLALFTLIQFPGGIAEQLSPLTRWLSGEKFSMHPDGKPKKHHGSLLKKLGIKKEEAAEAPAGEPLSTQAAAASGDVVAQNIAAAYQRDAGGGNGRSGAAALTADDGADDAATQQMSPAAPKKDPATTSREGA